MRTRNIIRTRRLAWSWFLTYTLILMIPILTSVIVAFSYQRTIRAEITRSNHAVLELTRHNIDQRFIEMKSISYQLSLNPRLIRYSNAKLPLNASGRMNLYQLTKDMSNYAVSNDFVDTLYVYFENTDAAVGSSVHYENELFYHYVIRPLGLTEDEWLNLLDQEHSYALIAPGELSSPTGKLLFMHRIQRYGTMSPLTLIGIIDKAKINWLPEHTPDPLSSVTMLLLDERNRPLVHVGDTLILPEDESLELKEEHTYEDNIQGHQMVVTSLESKESNLRYVILTPSDLYWEKARETTLILVAGALSSLIMGGVFIAFILRKQYTPVKNLIEYLEIQDLDHKGSHRDELDFIRRSVEATLESKHTMQDRLEAQNQLLRRNVMNRLLRGDVDPEYLAQTDFPSLDLVFTDSYFTIVAFYFDEYGDDLKLAHFTLRNIFEELISRDHPCYTTTIDSLMVCVINHEITEADVFVDYLMEHLETAASFLNQHFHFIIRASVSRPVEGMEEWSNAYYEATASLTVALAKSNKPEFLFVGSDEITPVQTDPVRQQKLANYLKTHDYASARKFVLETLDPINATQLTTEQWRYLHTLVLVTIVSNIDDETQELILGNEPFLKLHRLLFKQIDCTPFFIDLIDEIDQSNPNVDSRAQNLSAEIHDYIESNYQDANLNLTVFGDEFEMTPTYLARLYKDANGIALLDVLNQRRIKEAKRLLQEQTHLTIADIAEQSGFTNANSFIRVFKKYEGITPGRFRSHGNSE